MWHSFVNAVRKNSLNILLEKAKFSLERISSSQIDCPTLFAHRMLNILFYGTPFFLPPPGVVVPMKCCFNNRRAGRKMRKGGGNSNRSCIERKKRSRAVKDFTSNNAREVESFHLDRFLPFILGSSLRTLSIYHYPLFLHTLPNANHDARSRRFLENFHINLQTRENKKKSGGCTHTRARLFFSGTNSPQQIGSKAA